MAHSKQNNGLNSFIYGDQHGASKLFHLITEQHHIPDINLSSYFIRDRGPQNTDAFERRIN